MQFGVFIGGIGVIIDYDRAVGVVAAEHDGIIIWRNVRTHVAFKVGEINGNVTCGSNRLRTRIKFLNVLFNRSQAERCSGIA